MILYNILYINDSMNDLSVIKYFFMLRNIEKMPRIAPINVKRSNKLIKTNIIYLNIYKILQKLYKIYNS